MNSLQRGRMEQFIKIKKKFQKAAVLKSSLFGVGAGGVGAGVAFLVLKLTGTKISPLWLILGGLLLALLAFGVSFLALWPSDKRLAKYLDESMNLGEKVQTMVEFAEREGDVIELQRKDTEFRLQNAPKSALKVKRLWMSIVAASLAFVVVATAMIVPAKADVPNGGNGAEVVPPEPFETTDFHVAALTELIKYVQNSGMEATPKEKTVAELTGLLADVQTATTRDEMLDLVTVVMMNVDAYTEEANTYFELATAMTASTQVQVQKLGAAIGSLEQEKFVEQYAAMGEDFKDLTTAATVINEFSLALSVALVNSRVSDTDDLYLAIEGLRVGFAEQMDEVENYFEDAWGSNVNNIINTNNAPIVLALMKECVNDEVRDKVIYKLKEIFGMKADEMPQLSKDFENSSKPPEEGKDDDALHDGGLGTGDLVLGSDDIVYDPYTGEQVSYGEVIGRYYATYLLWIENGKLNPELEDMLQQYYDFLFKGIEDNKEEN